MKQFSCGHAVAGSCTLCSTSESRREDPLERAKAHVLDQLRAITSPSMILELAQAYEALCTGAAMVRPGE